MAVAVAVASVGKCPKYRIGTPKRRVSSRFTRSQAASESLVVVLTETMKTKAWPTSNHSNTSCGHCPSNGIMAQDYALACKSRTESPRQKLAVLRSGCSTDLTLPIPTSLQRRNRFSTGDIVRKVYAQIQTLLFEVLPLKGCLLHFSHHV